MIVVSSGMRLESLALVAQWFEMRAGGNEGVNDELVEEEGI